MVLEVWSIFPFAIKRIFSCSFENKCMRLLTRVYGMYQQSNSTVFVELVQELSFCESKKVYSCMEFQKYGL